MLIAAKAELKKREIEGWVGGLESEFFLKTVSCVVASCAEDVCQLWGS